jgi:chromate transporter
LWFALHFMFAEVDDASLGPISLERPRLDSLDMLALILSIGALVATFRFRVGVVGLLAGAAAAGLVLRGLLGL